MLRRRKDRCWRRLWRLRRLKAIGTTMQRCDLRGWGAAPCSSVSHLRRDPSQAFSRDKMADFALQRQRSRRSPGDPNEGYGPLPPDASGRPLLRWSRRSSVDRYGAFPDNHPQAARRCAVAQIVEHHGEREHDPPPLRGCPQAVHTVGAPRLSARADSSSPGSAKTCSIPPIARLAARTRADVPVVVHVGQIAVNAAEARVERVRPVHDHVLVAQDSEPVEVVFTPSLGRVPGTPDSARPS
jgi:hypothetical protein